MTAILPAHLTQLEDELRILQRRKTIYTLLAIVVTAGVVLFGVDMANTANATPFSQGIVKIFDFPADMFALSYELGFSRWFARVLEFVPDLLTTLNMALLSTFLGFVTAVILACGASNNIVPYPAVVTAMRRFLDLLRSVPEIVIALIFLYLMGKACCRPSLRSGSTPPARWASCFPRRSRISTTSRWKGCNPPAHPGSAASGSA